MKKLINTAMIYMILALIMGVFYREFTKFYQFTGQTALSVTHTHLFIFGVVLLLILALFLKDDIPVYQSSLFQKFFILYNISVPFFISMLMVRGIVEVINFPLSHSMNAMIAGISGLSHMFLAISLILYFMILRKKIYSK